MNVEIVSTSLVTRETSEPRRSAFWVSTDRSCTCRKARICSVARPPSAVRKSRTFNKYDDTAVTRTATAASPTKIWIRPGSGPPAAVMPESTVCCTATGTSTRPTVATVASRRVKGSPTRNSGDSARARRNVVSAYGWGPAGRAIKDTALCSPISRTTRPTGQRTGKRQVRGMLRAPAFWAKAPFCSTLVTTSGRPSTPRS